MKKSVGLVVMVKMPQEDGSEVLMAVLQRRGTFNTEKMKPESYPGCCQVTCHGGLEEGESFDAALIREVEEELGTDLAKCLRCLPNKAGVEILVHKETTEKEIITYGALIPVGWLKMIRLGPDSGGLAYMTARQMSVENPDLYETPEVMKRLGPNHRRTIAMFQDEIEAVRTAFEVFGKK